MFLLDTNIVSEARKGPRAHAQLAEWYERTPGEAMFLSVLVVGEIRRGLERVRPRDQHQAAALEIWLKLLLDGYRGRILGVGIEVAQIWGAINARGTFPVVDSLLAATAMHHGLTFVTRDLSGVRGCGARCLDPFTGETC